MLLRVRSITWLTEDINGYELVDPNGRDLPRFEAGAHIAGRLGEKLWRDYLLWNDPGERRRYCIAVLRGKEGPRAPPLHDAGRGGDIPQVSLPPNNFSPAGDAQPHPLVSRAGRV